VERSWIASELQASVGCVGAGDVQLKGRDSLSIVQNFDRAFVILAGVTEDVGHHYNVLDLTQMWQLFFEESLRPDVLQADRVEHASRRFPQPGRRIADHRLAGKTLHHESAELAQVHHVFEFDSITEGTARGNDRIF